MAFEKDRLEMYEEIYGNRESIGEKETDHAEMYGKYYESLSRSVSPEIMDEILRWVNDDYDFEDKVEGLRYFNYILVKNRKFYERYFHEFADKYSGQYKYRNGNYITVLPKNVLEILQEGFALDADIVYDVEDIVSQKFFVLFLRRSESPTIPYKDLYVEENKIVYIKDGHGCNLNRNEEEVMWLQDFARKAGLSFEIKFEEFSPDDLMSIPDNLDDPLPCNETFSVE